MLNRYIIYHNTQVGEQVATFDEGEELEVLKELESLGKFFYVYDKKTDKDYTRIQFKKAFKLNEELNENKQIAISPYSIFKNSIDSEGSEYYDLCKGIDTLYYKKEKNKYGLKEEMTGNEYYQKALDIFHQYKGSTETLDGLKAQREKSITDEFDKSWAPIGVNKVDYLKKCILEGKKLDMAYLDYVDHSQEGLHRIMAASELVGWDKKFPVLVVYPYEYMSEKELESYLNKLIKEDGIESKNGKAPKLDKNLIYTKHDFVEKVWSLIDESNVDIYVDDIKLSNAASLSKTRQMNIYITYFGNNYQFAISLRDPKEITKPLFDIVDTEEELIQITGYDRNKKNPFGDLTDAEIKNILTDEEEENKFKNK